MHFSYTHKTTFWYFLGVPFKISDDRPVTFIWKSPPGSAYHKIPISPRIFDAEKLSWAYIQLKGDRLQHFTSLSGGFGP